MSDLSVAGRTRTAIAHLVRAEICLASDDRAGWADAVQRATDELREAAIGNELIGEGA